MPSPRALRALGVTACSTLLLTGTAAANEIQVDPSVPVTAATVTPGVGDTIAGTTAVLRSDGTVAIPRDAPRRVQDLIAAANAIVGLPYKWGGGHGTLVDDGYDCSGAVSFALIGGGLLAGPEDSGTLAATLGVEGAGAWVTVYANADHAYLEVAGMRLDTSSVGDASGLSGVRWRPVIGQRSGFAARHVDGL
jgi:hypothetical protein